MNWEGYWHLVKSDGDYILISTFYFLYRLFSDYYAHSGKLESHWKSHKVNKITLQENFIFLLWIKESKKNDSWTILDMDVKR